METYIKDAINLNNVMKIEQQGGGNWIINTETAINGPTISDIYDKLQALTDTIELLSGRINALEQWYNGGNINVLSINGCLVGTNTGTLMKDSRFLKNAGMPIIPVLTYGNTEVDGKTKHNVSMEIGNVLDFHRLYNNDGGADDCHGGDLCNRIIVDQSSQDMVLFTHGLYHASFVDALCPKNDLANKWATQLAAPRGGLCKGGNHESCG